MNGRDVVESFSPLIVPFIVAILCGILGWIFGFGKWFKNVPVILGLLSAIICIAYVFKKSMQYNNGNKLASLAATCGKMTLSFLCLFMYNDLTRWDNKQSVGENWTRKANAAIWLAALIALMNKLVNGERVIARQSVLAR